MDSVQAVILGETPPNGAGSLRLQCTVYVPSDAVEKYKEATAWKSYTIKSIDEKPKEL